MPTKLDGAGAAEMVMPTAQSRSFLRFYVYEKEIYIIEGFMLACLFYFAFNQLNMLESSGKNESQLRRCPHQIGM